MSAQLPAPYVGLRPFEFNEASIFYGRGEHIAEMARTVRKGHFLAVVGSSGSGKSSLVRAGLLPAIAGGFMNDGEDEPDWRFVLMRPGLDPYENLLSALLPQLAPKQSLDQSLIEFRRQTLRGGPRGLVEVVADSLLPEATRLVVLVDQFEEIFRFLERGRSGQLGDVKASPEQRNSALAFVDLLLATAAERDRRVYIVLTMRSEYLGECEAFLGLSAAIAKHQFLTPRMTREQLQDIVERPIKAFGGTIEPVFVAGILNSLGTAQDQLPRVEHVLLRMWNHEIQERDGEPPALRMEDYRAVGGFESALDQHAEQLFSELGSGRAADEPSEKQRIAEQLFRALAARTSQGTLVRRLSGVGEVASIAGVTEEVVAEVVEHFRQPGANFLVATPAGPITAKTTLDISHESLLRQWVRLGKWVTAEADAASELQRLARDAQSWNEGKRGFLRQPELGLFHKLRDECFPSAEWAKRYVKPQDFDLADRYLQASLDEQKKDDETRKQDRRKQELRRGGIVVCLILLLLVIPLAVFALIGQEDAKTQAGIAKDKEKIAKEYADKATVQERIADQQRTEAEKKTAEAQQANAKLALQEQLIRVVQIVRCLAELGAVKTDAQFEVALKSWEVLSDQVREGERHLEEKHQHITNCLKRQFPNGLFVAADAARNEAVKSSIEKNPAAARQKLYANQSWIDFVNFRTYDVAHTLRDELLRAHSPPLDADLQFELQKIRTTSFERLELCVKKMLTSFENRPFDNAEPYVREFWLNYYGDFGLTEGDKVKEAMGTFGDELRRIEARLPAFAFEDQLRSYFHNIQDYDAGPIPPLKIVPDFKSWGSLLKGKKERKEEFEEYCKSISDVNEHFRKYSRMVYKEERKKLTECAGVLYDALVSENKTSVLVGPSSGP